jgi:hypothetical protein
MYSTPLVVSGPVTLHTTSAANSRAIGSMVKLEAPRRMASAKMPPREGGGPTAKVREKKEMPLVYVEDESRGKEERGEGTVSAMASANEDPGLGARSSSHHWNEDLGAESEAEVEVAIQNRRRDDGSVRAEQSAISCSADRKQAYEIKPETITAAPM